MGLNRQPLLVLMKGHPGTGKSTLANALARSLGSPLIDKDDVRDCTTHLEAARGPPESISSADKAISGLLSAAILNDLSYKIMWTVAATQPLNNGTTTCERLNANKHQRWQLTLTITFLQLSLDLTVVVDSPLSSLQRFTEAKQIAAAPRAKIVVIECKPSNEEIWRARVESRAAEALQAARSSSGSTSGWHKPSTWADIERLLEGYQGCWEYDIGSTPKLTLDTSSLTSQETLATALNFVWTHTQTSSEYQPP